jgi:hypothetical protein
MVSCDQQVAGERQLQPAAERMAVDGGDDRLVEVPELGQAGESAGAVIELPPLADLGAAVGRLDVPASREDPLAGGGDNADAQLRIVAQTDEGLAQQAAGDDIDGVDLRPVERDLEHVAALLDAHRRFHSSISRTTVKDRRIARAPARRNLCRRRLSARSRRRKGSPCLGHALSPDSHASGPLK